MTETKSNPEPVADFPRPPRAPGQIQLVAESPARPRRSAKRRQNERRQLELIARGEGNPAVKDDEDEAFAPDPAADPAVDPAAAPGAVPGAAPAADAGKPQAQAVRGARLQLRHWGLIASFVLVVLAPLAFATWYLYARAADQYNSDVSFSIRSEEVASAAAGLIGALVNVGGGGASDPDILYEYIRSQEIVAEIDASLDLRAIWNRAEGDPHFTLGDDPTIEALLSQWKRMVDVAYDSGTGIIHVQVRAFRPEDATAIAAAILEKSSALVNQLSEQARADAVRFADEELTDTETKLRDVRDRISAFRREYNIVDPQADVAGQMGLLNALQDELAKALVERDVLTSYAAEDDQRVRQADRRIAAITTRLEDERAGLQVAGMGASLPDIVGRYEALLVDQEFASKAYTQALAGVTAARAEARRQSRYLAAHIRPTVAESSLFPRRGMLAGLTGLFLLLGWGVLALFYYNVRDNR